jgi:Transposase
LSLSGTEQSAPWDVRAVLRHHIAGTIGWRSESGYRLQISKPRTLTCAVIAGERVNDCAGCDRSILDVARSLGLVEQTLGNWVRQARVDRGERADPTSDERAALTRLRRENAQLAMERDLPKRATAFLTTL